MKLPVINGLIVLALAAVSAAQTDAGQYRVVVHPSNPASTVLMSDLSAYLLKRKKTWPHGAAVEPVNLVKESPERIAFSKAVHGRSTASIDAFWQRQIFAGQAAPPPELGSAEVVAYVRERPGAVGYVVDGTGLDGVKEVGVVTDPEILSKVPARYTSLARRRGVEGAVVLRVFLAVDGRLTNVEALEELPFGLTDEAVQAVRQWTFRPAHLEGRPVPSSFDVKLNFKLE